METHVTLHHGAHKAARSAALVIAHLVVIVIGATTGIALQLVLAVAHLHLSERKLSRDLVGHAHRPMVQLTVELWGA